MAADSRYGDLLVKAGVLSSEQLQAAADSLPGSGVHLSEHLSATGILDQAAQVQAVGKVLKLTPVNLEHLAADEMALARIPGELALQHLVLPIELMPGERRELLQIAMVDPTSTAAIRALSAASRCLLRPVIAPIDQVRSAISRLYGLRAAPRGMPARPAAQPTAPSVQAEEAPVSTAETAGFSDLFTAPTAMAGRGAPVRTTATSPGAVSPGLDRLERALRAGEPAARRLFVKLVQQLSERNLIDIDRLLDD